LNNVQPAAEKTSDAATDVASNAVDNRGTADLALDLAEERVQLYGFNGFSYAHVAADLGISRAALHYHFASKAILGQALIDRYAERFTAALTEIDARTDDSLAKLRAYAKLYGDVLAERRMCLCGMLAAEYRTLPEAMQQAVLRFFELNEEWLGAVLAEGNAEGSLQAPGPVPDTARMIMGALEGAVLVARPYQDMDRFTAAADQLLAGLSSNGRGRTARAQPIAPATPGTGVTGVAG
jgi:TetR/AcrR family transcriptional regulator, transcriptional repressor for nem operon